MHFAASEGCAGVVTWCAAAFVPTDEHKSGDREPGAAWQGVQLALLAQQAHARLCQATTTMTTRTTTTTTKTTRTTGVVTSIARM